MTPQASARLIQGVGFVILATGAILMARGTTSIPLFIFFAGLAFAGILIFFAGKRRYEKSLG